MMTGARFIRAVHPKSDIAPTRAAVTKVLGLGWWGQLKIHGHRAQIHVPADDSAEVSAYNRQGALHRKILPPVLVSELRRIFKPELGWSVLDTEWLKDQDRLYVFDILKRADVLLDDWTYAERYELLPRVYASPRIETLPVLKTSDACMAALADPAPYIEGLVFRAAQTRGFLDSTIVRCRKTLPGAR